MSFWDDVNPFSKEENFWDAVPVVASARDIGQGRSGWETLADLTVAAPLITGGRALAPKIKQGFNKLKNAYDAPFDEKRAGYDAVADRAQQIKQERMARQDQTYARADAKYAPARSALSAVYGDPKSWKL